MEYMAELYQQDTNMVIDQRRLTADDKKKAEKLASKLWTEVWGDDLVEFEIYPIH